MAYPTTSPLGSAPPDMADTRAGAPYHSATAATTPMASPTCSPCAVARDASGLLSLATAAATRGVVTTIRNENRKAEKLKTRVARPTAPSCAAPSRPTIAVSTRLRSGSRSTENSAGMASAKISLSYLEYHKVSGRAGALNSPEDDATASPACTFTPGRCPRSVEQPERGAPVAQWPHAVAACRCTPDPACTAALVRLQR
mmetsp:Transcript_17433/g.52264  ORF Transcript_17433/g.52264 Transcript_17433/m.52264 type:complete len:200 (+) Transcript_17433:1706-2305(+)